MSQEPKQWFYHVSAEFVASKPKNKPMKIRIKVIRTRFELYSTDVTNNGTRYAGQALPERFNRTYGEWRGSGWITAINPPLVKINMKDFGALLEFLATHYPTDRVTKALLELI